MEPPHSVNTIYRLAGSWVKPSTRVEGGVVATYVTLEEENKRKGKNKNNRKKQGKDAEEAEKKPQRD